MKKINYRHICNFLLLGTILLTSCTSMYVSTAPNVSMFKNRNDLTIEGNGSLVDGFDLKAAYSPINHLGLKINGQYSTQNISHLFKPVDHSFIEGQIGGYQLIKINNNILHAELFFGYGEGNGSLKANSDYDIIHHYNFSNGIYKKWFMQLDLGFETKKGFKFGLSNRLGKINYKIIDMPTDSWIGYHWIIHDSFEPFLFITPKINNRLEITIYAGYINVSDKINGYPESTFFTNKIRTAIGLKYHFIEQKEKKQQ